MGLQKNFKQGNFGLIFRSLPLGTIHCIPLFLFWGVIIGDRSREFYSMNSLTGIDYCDVMMGAVPFSEKSSRP